MTKQEVKDEYKQTEGSPEVRAKIRRLKMESATKSAKQQEALENMGSHSYYNQPDAFWL